MLVAVVHAANFFLVQDFLCKLSSLEPKNIMGMLHGTLSGDNYDFVGFNTNSETKFVIGIVCATVQHALEFIHLIDSTYLKEPLHLIGWASNIFC